MAPLQVPNGSFSQFGPIWRPMAPPYGHSGPGKWFKHITLDVPSPDPTLIHTDHIFVKRQAKDGRYFSKNTGVRRAKRRAKLKLCIKKARKFDSRHFNNKSAYINTILGESSFGGSFHSTCHLIVSRWRSLVAT